MLQCACLPFAAAPAGTRYLAGTGYLVSFGRRLSPASKHSSLWNKMIIIFYLVLCLPDDGCQRSGKLCFPKSSQGRQVCMCIGRIRRPCTRILRTYLDTFQPVHSVLLLLARSGSTTTKQLRNRHQIARYQACIPATMHLARDATSSADAAFIFSMMLHRGRRQFLSSARALLITTEAAWTAINVAKST